MGSKPSPRAYATAPCTTAWASSSGTDTGGSSKALKNFRLKSSTAPEPIGTGPTAFLTPRQYTSTRNPQAVTRLARS
jgi:hypothetical protein